MTEGILFSDLAWIALCVGLLSALLAMRDLPAWLAVALALLRVAIPLVYFTVCAGDLWTELDDVTYFDQGQQMISAGFTPITAWTDPDGRETLQSLSGGSHVLYGWWNITAQYLFGEHYYAPVFLNVLLTFVAAALMRRILGDLGFSPGYQKWMQVFLIVHWDVVVWSSLMNLKDVLTQTMTIATFFFLLRLLQRRQARYAVGLVAMIGLFSCLRFYIPFLMAFAFGMWVVTQWSDWRKYPLALAGALVVYHFLPSLGEMGEQLNSWSDMIYAAGRFMMTPAPWRTAEGSYQILPAVLHWATILPALAGAYLLWRKCPTARLFLFYAAIVILFYGWAEELNGPRQRLQISFIFAWAQFHCAWALAGAPAPAAVLRRFSRETPRFPAAQLNAPQVAIQ